MDNELTILLEIKKQGLDAIHDVRNALAELAVQATITNLILRSTALGDVGGDGGSGGGGGGGGGFGALTGGFMAFLRAMPGQTWVAVLVAGIIALSLVFAPLVTLLVAATVAVTAFAVGATAMALVVGGLALPFMALAGAVVLLGGGPGVGAADALVKMAAALTNAKEALVEFDQEHTKNLTILQQHQREQLVENISNAQVKYNTAVENATGPMGVLVGQLDAMTEVWAKQAEPMAKIITLFVGSFIPLIQDWGSMLLSWFGARLPGAIKAIGQIFKDLIPDLVGFGEFIGRTFDHVFNDKEKGNIFEGLVRLGIQGLEGLVNNLVALSDWFEARLPKLGPIVATIAGALGGGFQSAMQLLGKIVDWVIANWGSITQNAQDFAKAFASVDWKSVGDDFKLIFDDLKSVNWGDVTTDLGLIAGDVTSIVAGVTELVLGLAFAFGWFDAIAHITWTLLSDVLQGKINQLSVIVALIQWIASWGTTNSAHRPPPGNFNPTSSNNSPPASNTSVSIVVQGNSSSDPQQMALTVSRQLRGLFAV